MGKISSRTPRASGSWKSLANQPSFNASTMLLLTDGTVMCHEENTTHWWRLSPDAYGDYANGTWTALSSMRDARLYFASAVLSDGRVFVAGGEYSGGSVPVDLNSAEIYDPTSDLWSVIPVPGWAQIGDAPCCVLPDGKVLLGSIMSTQTSIYDPVTNTWKSAATKDDSSSEETWTLLRDGSVFSAECTNHPQCEKFLTPELRWVPAAALPAGQDLVEASSIEIGPAVLLPIGDLFAVGATGKTGIYTSGFANNQPGTWRAGPTFPRNAMNQQLGAKDAPACLLPSGEVLCAVGPVTGNANDFLPPTSFYLFDGINLNQINSPPNSSGPPFEGRMLLVPSGQVLFANGSNDIEVYTPHGSPDPEWAAIITSCPTTLQRGSSHRLSGIRLNGWSQAVSYGDDATAATNYPIVRLTDTATGLVSYCRTFNHSSMGVQTRADKIVSTNVSVPPSAITGPVELRVIANGIESLPQQVTVLP